MNKLVALLLVVAVPALAQQKPTLVPSYEQEDAVEPAVAAASEPAHLSPKTWIITGVAVAAIVALVVGAFAVAEFKRASAAPVTQSDFRCSPAQPCDAWINQPPM